MSEGLAAPREHRDPVIDFERDWTAAGARFMNGHCGEALPAAIAALEPGRSQALMAERAARKVVQ